MSLKFVVKLNYSPSNRVQKTMNPNSYDFDQHKWRFDCIVIVTPIITHGYYLKGSPFYKILLG